MHSREGDVQKPKGRGVMGMKRRVPGRWQGSWRLLLVTLLPLCGGHHAPESSTPPHETSFRIPLSLEDSLAPGDAAGDRDDIISDSTSGTCLVLNTGHQRSTCSATGALTSSPIRTFHWPTVSLPVERLQ
ncbi:hypothetical protein K443DRAFT_291536 [Laccaria amethystina LaAM-08-1]|uniref:Uncharacterized protein n=1 Tax=Laccaria amethystina LaAM-08-1 TaxID=1095629 RepID=A0A0C9WV26_9AGAR|nr:hypothetical protein K443DRAFT_291536 [Laccaria amethystina LaAM-08-1]